MTCVTGVSGSGKSSLVNEILYKSMAKKLNRARVIPGKYKRIEGLEMLDKVIDIDQSPIGRTPRSNPRRRKAIKKEDSALTSRADAVKRAAEMESSRLRCISFRMYMCRVRYAAESATTVRHWR